jgi:hypothetical protein
MPWEIRCGYVDDGNKMRGGGLWRRVIASSWLTSVMWPRRPVDFEVEEKKDGGGGRQGGHLSP